MIFVLFLRHCNILLFRIIWVQPWSQTGKPNRQSLLAKKSTYNQTYCSHRVGNDIKASECFGSNKATFTCLEGQLTVSIIYAVGSA